MGHPLPRTAIMPPLSVADLPRPPAAMLRVLARCADSETELTTIAAEVATDPALAADLLRVVNSAYFGLDCEVSSVARAVTVLGVSTVRNRVLCLMVRAVTKAMAVPNVDSEGFAVDALRRAVAARELARLVSVDPDDAFTAGLLQDIGMLVLAVLNPGVTRTQWNNARRAPPDARHTLEWALFDDTHEDVLAALAEVWNLPAAMVEAIGCHHAAEPATALGKVLAAADWAATAYTAEDCAASANAGALRLAALLGIDAESAHDVIEAIPDLVNEAAAGLDMAVPAQDSLAALSATLNSQLAHDNLAFQEMNWQLEQALRERDTLAARLSRELEIAREIQCSLLPSQAHEDPPIWARNVAAQELSGDFYDYFTTPDGRLLFNLGDVSGKGLTAALLMAKTCSLFRCLGRRHDSLAEVMAIINDELAETAIRGMFVTMIAGAYDASTGGVQIVCAGHPPPLLWRDGKGMALAPVTDAPPLGILPGVVFDAHSIDLDGASLYLYSDGVSEATDDAGKALGVRGLARLIARESGHAPSARVDRIVETLLAQHDARRDDITLALLAPRGRPLR